MGKDKGMKRKTVTTIPSRMGPHRIIIGADSVAVWNRGRGGPRCTISVFNMQVTSSKLALQF